MKQYLKLLNTLENREAGEIESPVGDLRYGIANPGIENYAWQKKPHNEDKNAEYPVAMSNESPLGDLSDPFGDFHDFFREQDPSDSSDIQELDMYDEDVSAFHEESPLGNEDAPSTQQSEEDPVGGIWDFHGSSRGVVCEAGEEKSGWMPRKYTVHMLKLKATCAAECSAAPNCMAFSWDFSVPMNGRGQCTFKKDFDNRKLITSGGWGNWGTVVVRCPYRPRVDYYGKTTCRIGDYRHGYMPSGATVDIPKLKEECQLECMYSDRCMAFSWNFALDPTQMGVCHFKRWYNKRQITKMQSWGTVVVRCPPTTTTTPKGGAAAATQPAKSVQKALEVGLKEGTNEVNPGSDGKSQDSSNPELHEVSPGVEVAVGAYELEFH